MIQVLLRRNCLSVSTMAVGLSNNQLNQFYHQHKMLQKLHIAVTVCDRGKHYAHNFKSFREDLHKCILFVQTYFLNLEETLVLCSFFPYKLLSKPFLFAVGKECGSCLKGQVMCSRNDTSVGKTKCINRAKICDGNFDCPNHEDEKNCTINKDQIFTCADGSKYIQKYKHCDSKYS